MNQPGVNQHELELYTDTASEYRWRVRIGVNIVADSGEGYKNRKDALAGFFGMFFGVWGESYLEAYQEWAPENAQDVGVPTPDEIADDPPPTVEEQAGAAPWADSDPAR